MPTATANCFARTALPDGKGEILAAPDLPPAQAEWFDADHWGEAAQLVAEGGRGAAWFVDAPFASAVLRRYRRGGLVAKFNRDQYWFSGGDATRSFRELQLTQQLHQAGLPVPRPLAACYQREGQLYRAAIVLQRLPQVRSLAALAAEGHAPWQQTGELLARFHRAGLDHADLNAHNILFDDSGQGWLIDFDRGRLRKPAQIWREANLSRLLRSLQKLRGDRSRGAVEADFQKLHDAHDNALGYLK